MKLICFLTIALLLSASVIGTKIRFSTKNKGFGTNLWSFACGGLSAFTGMNFKPEPNGVPAAIAKCIPPEWKGKQSSDESGGEKGMKGGKGILSKILTWKIKTGCFFGHCIINVSVDGVVSKVCSFLGPILKVLSRRRFRRRYFLETSNRRKKLYLERVFSKALRNKIKVKRGIFDIIKKAVAKIVKPVLDKIKTWVMNFLKKIPIINKVLNMLKCLNKLAKGVAAIVQKRVSGLLAAVGKIFKGVAGIIEVLLKTICQWKTFKQALFALDAAFNSTGATKWYKMGLFVGGLLAAMADAMK